MEHDITVTRHYQPGMPKIYHKYRKSRLFVTKVAGSEINLRWRAPGGVFINKDEIYYVKCFPNGNIQWHLLGATDVFLADHLVGTDNVHVVIFIQGHLPFK